MYGLENVLTGLAKNRGVHSFILIAGVFTLLYAGVNAGPAQAEDEVDAYIKPVTVSGEKIAYIAGNHYMFQGTTAPRLTPYGQVYALAQATEDDEWALEAQYGFQYTFYDCRRSHKDSCNDKNWTFRPSVYFKYQGEFDFYMFTRPSSPVVNRISNPALHVFVRMGDDDFLMTDNPLTLKYFNVGFEHRSNGQTRDALVTQVRSQRAYDLGNDRYFDGLSRSSNYISLAAGSQNIRGLSWEAKTKFFFAQEADVNWGPLSGVGVDFHDYDMFNLSLGYAWYATNGDGKIEPKVALTADYTMGLRGFRSDAIELALSTPVHLFNGSTKIPLMFRFHHGPMEKLSDYTRSITSFGVGFAFRY